MTTSGADGRVIDADRRSAFTGRTWVRWTTRMKNGFLDHLAATCNIKESAAAIGVEPVSLYALRRRDPAFAAAWREALVLGYDVLETLVVGHVIAGRRARVIEDGPYGPIDVDQALRLLTHHRGALHGKAAKGGPRPSYATRAETDAALLKALDALDRQKVAGEEAGEEVGGEKAAGEQVRGRKAAGRKRAGRKVAGREAAA